MELSLNPNTVQRAYQELERAGYIYTVKGKGSFVSESTNAVNHKREELQEELQTCLKKAMAAGFSMDEFREMIEEVIAKFQKDERERVLL